MTQFLDFTNLQGGVINILEAGAILNIPDNFYFLSAEDTRASSIDPELDKVAVYGIGALVVGKVIEKVRSFI